MRSTTATAWRWCYAAQQRNFTVLSTPHRRAVVRNERGATAGKAYAQPFFPGHILLARRRQQVDMEQGASLTISEAAKLAGVDRTTIHRALKGGKLSFTTDAHGVRHVTVAELERVYPLRRPVGAAQAAPAAESTSAADDAMAARVAAEAEARLLRERVRDLEADRDAWRDQAQRLLLARPQPQQERAEQEAAAQPPRVASAAPAAGQTPRTQPKREAGSRPPQQEKAEYAPDWVYRATIGAFLIGAILLIIMAVA